MENISHQYIGAIAIIIFAVFQFFKVDVTESQITSGLTAIVALYVAIRRFNQGDIKVSGVKR